MSVYSLQIEFLKVPHDHLDHIPRYVLEKRLLRAGFRYRIHCTACGAARRLPIGPDWEAMWEALSRESASAVD